MQDNILVAIRVRPPNHREANDDVCIQLEPQSNSILVGEASTAKNFSFDYIANESTSQEQLFETVGKGICINCLQGYNGTIFAYGESGSGKTFTIIGPSSTPLICETSGMLPRCLSYIISKVEHGSQLTANVKFELKCKFYEIYQEKINDLLTSHPNNLQLRKSPQDGCYVDGVVVKNIASTEEAMQLIDQGLKNRHTSSTLINKKSSRSHSIFTLQIECQKMKDEICKFTKSYFHLVDLAGSERQKVAGTEGERLNEASLINKSLSVLGRVISSLVDISQKNDHHVPYRESKLTFLLQDSLGGSSKTLLIANIVGSVGSFSETLSTLRFASNVKLVKNVAVINKYPLNYINKLAVNAEYLQQLQKNPSLVKPNSYYIQQRLEVVRESSCLVDSYSHKSQQSIFQQRLQISRESSFLINPFCYESQQKPLHSPNQNFTEEIMQRHAKDISNLEESLQKKREKLKALKEKLKVIKQDLRQTNNIVNNLKQDIDSSKNRIDSLEENLNNRDHDYKRESELDIESLELPAEKASSVISGKIPNHISPIKQPCGSFVFYCINNRQQKIHENRHATSIDITKLLADEWKALPQAESRYISTWHGKTKSDTKKKNVSIF